MLFCRISILTAHTYVRCSCNTFIQANRLCFPRFTAAVHLKFKSLQNLILWKVWLSMISYLKFVSPQNPISLLKKLTRRLWDHKEYLASTRHFAMFRHQISLLLHAAIIFCIISISSAHFGRLYRPSNACVSTHSN